MKKSYRKFFKYASDAMDLMAKHNIPPRPVNYRVWFEYIAHSTPALNEAIDLLQKDHQPFDENVTVNLHNEFFNQGSLLNETVTNTGDQLSEKLNSALELIRSAGRDTQVYGSALDSISSDLDTRNEKDLTGDSLQTIVDTLVTATTEMSDHTRKLEQQLHENTLEVEHLKQNLAIVQQESLTDPLTKLGNRKHFDMELEKAATLSDKTSKPMFLIMSDIDRFKVFNDTWGHQTGDQVLRLVAHCLVNDVREDDITARYGGEEFALILRSGSLEDAMNIAEKVRETVQSKKVMKRSTGEDLGSITISLGIAQYRPGEELYNLIERADACLYEAKSAGRNCVITETGVEIARKVS
jgi:diguanylate cyclase